LTGSYFWYKAIRIGGVWYDVGAEKEAGMTSDQALIRGQRVSAVKVERARELRRGMTPAEKLLWERLRGGSFDGLRWRRQQVIDGFIVDFYCHAARLVVELDGAVHNQQAEYDSARDTALAARHLLIVRFTNTEVETDITNVLARIHSTCQERIQPE
jgi:very-short-patch-repair endonuclease